MIQIHADKMLVEDQDSGQAGARESGSADDQFNTSELTSPEPAGETQPDTAVENRAVVEPAEELAGAAKPRKAGALWRLMAAISALILTALTIAGVYLLTKKPSTVDQVVILTVPSGAEISLDSKDYGHSPVKLEQLPIGTYTLTITKEGFEPIVKQVTISESQPLEFKLKPLAPSGTAGLTAEEYQRAAEEALARGYYGLIYEGSALNYADLLIDMDGSNSFAHEMRERVQKTAHQAAQAAVSRGDLAQAQEIYKFLTEYYADDEEARAAALRIETQLSNRRGEIRGLVRKAEEALQAGNLIEPRGANAWYYSKQALAISQDAEARRVLNQVRERLVAQSEQAFARGDVDSAIKQLDQITLLFKEDKQLRSRLREMIAFRNAESAKATDWNAHRIRGLELYQKDEFGAAIPELQIAMNNGMAGPEVLFALARSYMKIGDLDKATSYFLKVPQSADASYRSSIAAMGEILENQGDAPGAVEKYKEARRLGGSTLYTIAALNDRIEKIERRERERVEKPTSLTIQVRHLHGGLLGRSCAGPLTVNSTGVRYEGNEHVFSANLVGVSVRISKDEMSVQFQSPQKFKVARSEAERFRESLARFQQVYSPGQ